MASVWVIDFVLLLVLLATSEIMYRVGRRHSRRGDAGIYAQVSTVQTATLGLLALILGFGMSMAESRFNTRRIAGVNEANAIGTTYLRAGYLPDPQGSESRELLAQYVKERRSFFSASESEVDEVNARAEALHRQLWARAVAVGRAHPDWNLTAIYIESLNQMIDLETSRTLAAEARMPGAILMLLWVMAILAVGITSYATALHGRRNKLSLIVVPAMIAFAMAMVADLDRARTGVIHTSDRAMEIVEHNIELDQASDRNRAVLP